MIANAVAPPRYSAPDAAALRSAHAHRELAPQARLALAAAIAEDSLVRSQREQLERLPAAFELPFMGAGRLSVDDLGVLAERLEALA